MILCVTLNPCLDKTLEVPKWRPGDSVRGLRVREIVGGKGNNVARALSTLGHRDVRPVTFLGGSVGGHCEWLLRHDDQLDPVVIPSAAPTRVILTVRSTDAAAPSAFFDPDPAISEPEARLLVARVTEFLEAGNVRALTLSGSSPASATNDVFARLIAAGRARQIPTFLDSYGPPLRMLGDAWPSVIQLNRREAGQLLDRGEPTELEIRGLLEGWAASDVACAVVTNGPEPAFGYCEGRYLKLAPPPIHEVNPVGSGDCFLAGLVDGRLRGLDALDTLRHAAACGASNASHWDAGAINLEDLSELAGACVLHAWDL